MKLTSVIGALVFAGGVLPLTAGSALALCNVYDVTAENLLGSFNSDACTDFGPPPNPATLIDLLSSTYGDFGWELGGKFDVGGGEETGSSFVNFSFTEGDLKSGTWSVLPEIKGPFAISLFGGAQGGLYFFESIEDVFGGTWNMSSFQVGQGPRPNVPDLSNIGLYITSKPEVEKVPEPSAVAALFAVVGGTLLMKKQQSQSA